MNTIKTAAFIEQDPSCKPVDQYQYNQQTVGTNSQGLEIIISLKIKGFKIIECLLVWCNIKNILTSGIWGFLTESQTSL